MKRTFSVPDGLAIVAIEVVCAVIDAIPSDWAVIRGILRAPDRMLETGEALRSTQLVFKSAINQMIDLTGKKPADVFGILFEGKNPASVEFGEIFGHSEVMPMDQHKKTAVRFIQLGYRGRLEFIWRLSEDRGPDPFSCEIWMPTQAADDKVPAVQIESHGDDHPESGGTVAPIVEVCERLKLKELQPTQTS